MPAHFVNSAGPAGGLYTVTLGFPTLSAHAITVHPHVRSSLTFVYNLRTLLSCGVAASCMDRPLLRLSVVSSFSRYT